MRRPILSILGVLSLLIGLGAGGALAATTTLSFDEFSNATGLTTQYQSRGVTATGATIFNAVFTPWPAYSGSYIAVAQTGLMTFTVDSAITGNIQSVSAYVSGSAGTGLYAYDASGTLLGQALLPSGAPSNTLLSVTSSGNPITRVDIHDGGTSFGVDDLSFATAVVNNLIPVADAGDKQKVRTGSLVTLDGSRSVDPDHQPQPLLTYLWKQVSGPTVALSGATTVNPTFRPSTQGNYVFSLVVNDGQSSSNVSMVKVTASKNGNLSAEAFGDCVLCNPFGQ